MKLNKQIFVYMSIMAMLFSFPQYFSGIEDKNNQNIVIDIDQTSNEYFPDTFAELSTRTRTRNFIESTRAIPENNGTSLENIFYRVSSIALLDPLMGNMSTTLKDYWIDQILSFQNLDGGFGGWQYDRSSISHTYQAISTLSQLGYDFNTSFDKNLVLTFLERLRNTLTFGYNSFLSDTDSDIIASSYAVKTYNILGAIPPNSSLLINHLSQAQNLDPAFVPTIEIGGYGKQTNNAKNIYWLSEISVSLAAVESLILLSQTPQNITETGAFVKQLQTLNGGYVNDPYRVKVTSTFTSSALKLINLIGDTPLDAIKARDYLLSLETVDSGFKYQQTSQSSSPKATYFSLLGLTSINENPSNIQNTINYLISWGETSDGYAAIPGETAGLRETFDGVVALDQMGLQPSNPSGIAAYVDTYRNLDGGYGITGSFVDSTNRAMQIYSLLGLSIPNAATTITFLQSLQQPDGGFSKKSANSTSFVISTYRSMVSLQILGVSPLDTQAAINYLKSNQNPDGGFGGFVGDTSDVSSTYRAVRALSILGDTNFNVQAAVLFLQGSQIPDGGFKRSNYDIVRPNNNSHAVYTYSALRALQLMNAKPNNVTGSYYFIKNLRNRDGGYGKHDKFTSDIAYTFTSLWILRNFHDITSFSISIASDLNTVRSQYDNFTLSLNGDSRDYNYTIININSSGLLLNGLSQNFGNITVDTSSFVIGTTQLQAIVFDFTGAQIDVTFNFTKFEIVSTPPPTTSTPPVSSSTLPTSSTTQTLTSSSNTNPQDINESLPIMNILIGVGAFIVIAGVVLIIRRK